MLPKKILVSRARWVWIGFLLLSPLAYLLSGWLVLKYDAAAQTGLAVDRSRAIAIAAELAASKGIGLSEWTSLCRLRHSNDLHYYQRLPPTPERDLARRIKPATVINVLFRSPDRTENIEVELTVDGRVIGFSRRTAQLAEEEDPGEPVARSVAQEALGQRLAAAGASYPIELQLAETPVDAGAQQFGLPRPTGTVRRYTWKWPLETIPELKLESNLTVTGRTLTSDRTEASVDEAFVNRHLGQRTWLKAASFTAYVLAIIVFVVFGIYRFVQRARQKEVSYSRVAVLVVAFAVAMSSFALSSDTVVYDVTKNPGFPLPDWVLLFSTCMFYLVLGLFIGMAYGSGEGDIREAYPGKLASLDSLLVGKLFSRNVARSTVWGWAIGGWLMLGFQLAALPWAITPGRGEPPNPLTDAWVGYFPSLAAFLTWPSDVMLVTVIGLLVPLPLLHRRRKLGKAKLPLIFLFAWVACAAPYLDFRPWEGALLVAAIRALSVLVAFFVFDFLTVIIALATPTFLSFALGLAAQPAASLRQAGWTSVALAIVVFLVELIFIFKGKNYREEEVRPLYASNLAERVSMQAEVSAAREAQQRLMPASLPRSEHFSIAASCLPAYEVGGDFYDVFDLEPGKVGVLIAEGGGRGLGSALSIAYAKGFLMPKILGGGQTDDSPTEVIRGLQDRLAALLDEESTVGVAYIVIDAADGRLRYARTGSYPVVMTCKKDEPGKLMQPEERDIKFSLRQNNQAYITVTEGSVGLDQGDSVVLFTDGLVKSWQQSKKSPVSEFTRILSECSEKATEEMQQTLAHRINDYSKRARKQGVEDDLTAVIIRLDKVEDQGPSDNRSQHGGKS